MHEGKAEFVGKLGGGNAMGAGGRQMSRRDFLRLSGISVMSVAGLTVLTGCGPSSEGSDEGSSDATTESGSSFGTDGKMRVGNEAAYAPYNWQTDTETEYTIPLEGMDGAYEDGFDVVVAKKIGEALDLEPVGVKMEFSGLIEALTSGQIDIIIAGMAATDERRESIDFSDAYFNGGFGLMVQQGSQYESATSLDDFAGAAVLGQENTNLDYVIDEIPDVNHLTPVDSVPTQFSYLEQGACDAITYSSENREGYLRAHPTLTAVAFDGDYTLFSLKPTVNCGLAKGQDDILDKINDVLADYSEEDRQADWDAVCERQPA